MLFQLLIALVVLSVASATMHLRGEIQSEDVPLNPALFEKYAAHMFPQAAVNTSRSVAVDLKTLKKGKSAAQIKSKKTLNSGSYLVTRKYRNGDCTGAVTEFSGVRLNTCVYDVYGDAYSHHCEAGDDKTVPHTIHQTGTWQRPPINYDPNNPTDCTFGFGSYTRNVTTGGNKCELDGDSVVRSGYQMQSASCGEPMPEPGAFAPGILSIYSDVPNCDIDQTPAAFRYQPFGVCEMFVDHSRNYGRYYDRTAMDENTDFYYIKMVSCDANGMVFVHAYSDPACSRKMFRGVLDLSQHPSYDSCWYDSGMDMTGTMFCVGGQP